MIRATIGRIDTLRHSIDLITKDAIADSLASIASELETRFGLVDDPARDAVISKETAVDIALAYREVEAAEKLLDDIEEASNRRAAPDIRDAFGRLQDGLELGVPSGDAGRRLFNVPWSLAKPVIQAHIAAKKAAIVALTERARVEIGAGSSAGRA